MNVGYLRFSSTIELDYMDSSVTKRGTGVRLGVLEAMVEDGHDVTLLTKSEDKNLLEGEEQLGFGAFDEDTEEDGKGPIDYTFLEEGVEADHKTRDMSQFDVLFIESGPPNVLYGSEYGVVEYDRKFDGDTPHIWRTFDCVDRFEGHVFYWQHDLKLPFPFGEATKEMTPGVSARNLTRMGNEVDFHKNKEWSVGSYCFNPAVVEEEYDGKRFAYDRFDFEWTIIPCGYSENIDQRFDPRPWDEMEHEMIYIGSGDRSQYRRDRVWEYYDDPGYDSGIIGAKWDEFKRNSPNLKFHGPVGGHGDVYRISNWAGVSVMMGCELFERAKMMTPRAMNGIMGGNVVLCDEPMYSGYHFDEKYVVSSTEDVQEQMEEIKQLSAEERKEIQEEQLSTWDKWTDYDWTKILSEPGRYDATERVKEAKI